MGQPGKTSLAAGETTTFTVTLNTDAIWSGGRADIVCQQRSRQRRRRGEPLHVPGFGKRDGSCGRRSPFWTERRTSPAARRRRSTWAARSTTRPVPARRSRSATTGIRPSRLTTPFASTAHFTVGQPGKTSLAAGRTTTFTVTLNTGAVGRAPSRYRLATTTPTTATEWRIPSRSWFRAA